MQPVQLPWFTMHGEEITRDHLNQGEASLLGEKKSIKLSFVFYYCFTSVKSENYLRFEIVLFSSECSSRETRH